MPRNRRHDKLLGQEGHSRSGTSKSDSKIWQTGRCSIPADEVVGNAPNTLSLLAEKQEYMKKCFRSCSWYKTPHLSVDDSLLLSAECICHCHVPYSFVNLQENSLSASLDVGLIPKAQKAGNLSFWLQIQREKEERSWTGIYFWKFDSDSLSFGIAKDEQKMPFIYFFK